MNVILSYIKNLLLLSSMLVITSIAFAETKLERLGQKLFHPWGMSLLSDYEVLVTERRGKLYKINLKNGLQIPINNLPKVFSKNQGGLLDIIVNKENKDKIEIFFCYSSPMPKGSTTSVNSAILDGSNLTNQKTIFIANNTSSKSIHYGCRLVIVDNHIFISLGDRGERDNAQNGKSHSGSVIRIGLDGSIPKDNNQNSDWLPEILSKGHRNPQGMAVNPNNFDVWINEHGPKGGDEINVLEPGKNYGWPIVSYGDEYSGAQIGEGLEKADGFSDPIWYWKPSIAPSGMTFYNGKMFPEFNGDLIVSSLKFQSIYHVKIDKGLPVKQSFFLKGVIGRIRDLEVAQDGSILILTDESEGGLYKLFR